MSTAITVKEEILAQKTTAECCRLAFLAGAIAGCGSLSIGREGLGLILQNQNEELIKKCASLLSQITGKEPAIVKRIRRCPSGSGWYTKSASTRPRLRQSCKAWGYSSPLTA